MEHRGRIQAQGKNIEESESWSQDEPPTIQDGLEMIERLRNKIPKKDAQIRETAFEKLARLIKNAINTNGIDAPVKLTFKAEGYVRERVDLEVIKGKAFINEPDKNEKK